jgi:hypothetical protein
MEADGRVHNDSIWTCMHGWLGCNANAAGTIVDRANRANRVIDLDRIRGSGTHVNNERDLHVHAQSDDDP